MLNHMYLRDYSKWYTVFGNILTSFIKPNKEKLLFLHGLNVDHFINKYSDIKSIDPVPEFSKYDSTDFEKITMGHCFPDKRATDTEMIKVRSN